MYPEPRFPAVYPVGAGYGVSRKFIEDAFDGGHFMNLRLFAFEDVAMGEAVTILQLTF